MDDFSDRSDVQDLQNPVPAGRAPKAWAAGILRHSAWSVAAVLLIGFNLRPSITTVALFIADIKRDLGLSTIGISVLTMLPVVCLGLFAPAAPLLARRFGIETVLLGSLVGVAVR